ncbi:MAG: hypothetical protein ACRD8A_10215 [Candidatus Acidiferrales bacterium]
MHKNRCVFVFIATATAVITPVIRAAVAQISASQVGREKAVPVHLQDGQEQQMPLAKLIAFGESLFVARFTTEDGLGRPLTKGTGAPLSDPSSPLVFPRNSNRISGPESQNCAACHNLPRAGGGGDRVGDVFVMAQRFDFATFDRADLIPTRGAMDEAGNFATLQNIADERKTIGMFGSGYIEMLARQMTADLEAVCDHMPAGTSASLQIGTYSATPGDNSVSYTPTSLQASVAGAQGNEYVVTPTSEVPEVDGVSTGNVTITGEITDESTGCRASAQNSNTVLGITISQRAVSGESISSDNGAKPNDLGASGTISLGPIIRTGMLVGCGVAVETVGTVSPSTYTGSIVIRRTVVSDGTYTNSTYTGEPKTPGEDDTSFAEYQDQDPQSGGSSGKIYDYDDAGIDPTGTGTPYRLRFNYTVYAATSDGTIVSTQSSFYVRMSCEGTSNGGYQFATDVAGDNIWGTGSTLTSWNLQ